jgi:hypothetical protein
LPLARLRQSITPPAFRRLFSYADAAAISFITPFSHYQVAITLSAAFATPIAFSSRHADSHFFSRHITPAIIFTIFRHATAAADIMRRAAADAARRARRALRDAASIIRPAPDAIITLSLLAAS